MNEGENERSESSPFDTSCYEGKKLIIEETFMWRTCMRMPMCVHECLRRHECVCECQLEQRAANDEKQA